MFEELFQRKCHTISYQNHHILTKKMSEIDISCAINTNIYKGI
jgi:hypothetical protein